MLVVLIGWVMNGKHTLLALINCGRFSYLWKGYITRYDIMFTMTVMMYHANTTCIVYTNLFVLSVHAGWSWGSKDHMADTSWAAASFAWRWCCLWRLANFFGILRGYFLMHSKCYSFINVDYFKIVVQLNNYLFFFLILRSNLLDWSFVKFDK